MKFSNKACNTYFTKRWKYLYNSKQIITIIIVTILIILKLTLSLFIAYCCCQFFFVHLVVSFTEEKKERRVFLVFSYRLKSWTCVCVCECVLKQNIILKFQLFDKCRKLGTHVRNTCKTRIERFEKEKEEASENSASCITTVATTM